MTVALLWSAQYASGPGDFIVVAAHGAGTDEELKVSEGGVNGPTQTRIWRLPSPKPGCRIASKVKGVKRPYTKLFIKSRSLLKNP